MVCLAYWAWRREHEWGTAGKIAEKNVYWLVMLSVLGVFLLIATVPMPPAYVAGVFTRPFEFIPALLFLAAFAGHYRKQFQKLNGFDFWLMTSLLLSIGCHGLFMSLSVRPFDAMFDMAHVLKVGSYAVVLWGLLASVYSTYRRVDLAAGTLRSLNVQLQEEVAQRAKREDDLRVARDEAQASNKAKSQFLANMSHELRTPLNSVIGFTNILHKNKAGNLSDKEVYYLARILDNGRHLLGLINDVLDLSKIEAGKLEVELTSVNTADLITQVLCQFESMVKDSGIDLRTDIPRRVRPVQTDETKLKQILVNLVGNAVKFTHEGSVTVALVVDPETHEPLRIDVVDTGTGIPADRVDAVFDTFTQAEGGTDRKYEGTGLGLSISRSLARLLGHELVADSVLDHGSTFSVLLDPDVARARHTLGNRPAEVFSLDPDPAGDGVLYGGGDGTLRGRLVLIIDDNRDCQTLIRHYAEETGCRVMISDSGREGLALTRRHQPDLIMLDLMMPEMDGWEVLRRCKADPEIADIPVVIVSIVGTDNRYQLTDAADVFNKPLEREELFAALNRQLADEESGADAAPIHLDEAVGGGAGR